ncbi:hypothetical protein SCHPADRAFT_790657, partial [Schizopora paradoxa]
VAAFASEVRAWWTALMPGWRLPSDGRTAQAAWPLQRNVPETEDWKKVRKIGPNGIFLVLLALSWW